MERTVVRDKRRIAPEKRNTWQVSRIWEMHHEIIRFLILGYTNKEISLRLKTTPEHISSIRNSPIIMERLSLMSAARDVEAIEISRDILKITPKSLALLEDVINGVGEGKDASIGLRVKAAESNLDRAGFGAVKKVLSENHNYYTDADIADMKRRAIENNDIVEGEFVEERDARG